MTIDLYYLIFPKTFITKKNSQLLENRQGVGVRKQFETF
jgi:hypothetical protein